MLGLGMPIKAIATSKYVLYMYFALNMHCSKHIIVFKQSSNCFIADGPVVRVHHLAQFLHLCMAHLYVHAVF